MKIKEFKQKNIQEITNEDLRGVLYTTFNKKIVKDIQEEFLRREIKK